MVNREMPRSRGWIPGGLQFSQPIKPGAAGRGVCEGEVRADNRRHARGIEPVTGGVKSSVDCNVNPGAFVGQERMSSLPLGVAFKNGSNGTVPMSATV